MFTAWDDAQRLRTLPKTLVEGFAQARRLFKSRWMAADEAAMFHSAGHVVADRHEPSIPETVRAGQRYLPFNIGGESILTLGRAVLFAHGGAALIVNASPFGCMAGTVCTALFSRFESELSIPVVNLFYDGTGEENSKLAVHLANLNDEDRRAGPPRPVPTPRRRGFAVPFGRERATVTPSKQVD
jgi:hypothetical protein